MWTKVSSGKSGKIYQCRDFVLKEIYEKIWADVKKK